MILTSPSRISKRSVPGPVPAATQLGTARSAGDSRPLRVLALVLGLLSLGASCGRTDGGGVHPEPRPSRTPAKTKAAATKTRPQGPAVGELRGVDLGELSSAERRVVLAIANDQLSPCGDPVSVARCLQSTECRACPRAARYIVRLVKDGYERSDVELLVGARFGRGQETRLEVGASPVRGPEMASLTIMEFSDFECPHCARAAPVLHRIVRAMDGRARLVFKNYPLEMHQHAMDAARAALAAGRQGKFWEMHDLLFENQTTLEISDIERFAQQLGLDMTRFRADARSPAIQRLIDADIEQGHQIEVDSTPTILVNGRRYLEPIEDLERYLREELEG